MLINKLELIVKFSSEIKFKAEFKRNDKIRRKDQNNTKMSDSHTFTPSLVQILTKSNICCFSRYSLRQNILIFYKSQTNRATTNVTLWVGTTKQSR